MGYPNHHFNLHDKHIKQEPPEEKLIYNIINVLFVSHSETVI